MVQNASAQAHKCAGALGSSSRPPEPSVPREGQEGSGAFGQPDSGDLHQQTRRDQESLPLSGSMQAPHLVQAVGHLSHGFLPSGPGQHHSRPPVQAIATTPLTRRTSQGVVRRVEVVSTGMQTDLRDAGSSARRSVRIPGQSPASSILFKRGTPGSHRRRRSVAGLVGNGRVRLSSHSLDPQSSVLDCSDRQLSDPPSGSLVASSPMVCAAARAVGRVTSPPPEGRRSSAGPLPQVPGPAADTPVPPIDCLDSLQQSFQAAGLSKGAASLASKARRSSTRYTYNSRLVRFSPGVSTDRLVRSRPR